MRPICSESKEGICTPEISKIYIARICLFLKYATYFLFKFFEILGSILWLFKTMLFISNKAYIYHIMFFKKDLNTQDLYKLIFKFVLIAKM